MGSASTPTTLTAIKQMSAAGQQGKGKELDR